MSSKRTIRDVIEQLEKEGETPLYIISVLETMIDDNIKGYTSSIQTSIDSFFPVSEKRNVNKDKINLAINRRLKVDNIKYAK
jgi:hypothetical protein